MRNYPKSWEDENVNFWVSKKSEQMLEQDWVTPSRGVKEGGVKVSVYQ
jgi:hypothetical protein